jgi:hypothetical protein
MSDSLLSHRTRNLPATIGTAAASSTSLLIADMAAGTVHVDGVTATHTVAVYGSADGVTFVPLHGPDGQAATIAVPAAGGACTMPDAVYPLRFVKLVSGTDLGTAASVVVSVKS